MTNHKFRSKTYFTVRYGTRYGTETAKFSSNRDAMYFAEAQSAKLRVGYAEVRHKTGLVGQYSEGKTTPEFQLHHDLRDNG